MKIPELAIKTTLRPLWLLSFCLSQVWRLLPCRAQRIRTLISPLPWSWWWHLARPQPIWKSLSSIPSKVEINELDDLKFIRTNIEDGMTSLHVEFSLVSMARRSTTTWWRR